MTSIGALRRRGKVLVIARDRAVVQAIEMALDNRHEVITTANYRDVVDYIRLGTEPDLMVSDLGDVGDRSGLKLHAGVARVAPHLVERIVFLVGNALDQTTTAFLDSVGNQRLDRRLAGPRILDIVTARTTR